jgi:hypothetical protein
MNVKGKHLPSSSVSHWKVEDEDSPFGAGLWRRFLGEWGRRPSDQEKKLSALGDGDNHCVHFFIEGPPKPPSALGVGPHRTPTSFWDPITSSHLHTGTARPPLTPQSPSATVVPSKKPRSGRRECLPQDGEGGKVFKRNSTFGEFVFFKSTFT